MLNKCKYHNDLFYVTEKLMQGWFIKWNLSNINDKGNFFFENSKLLLLFLALFTKLKLYDMIALPGDNLERPCQNSGPFTIEW